MLHKVASVCFGINLLKEKSFSIYDPDFHSNDKTWHAMITKQPVEKN